MPDEAGQPSQAAAAPATPAAVLASWLAVVNRAFAGGPPSGEVAHPRLGGPQRAADGPLRRQGPARLAARLWNQILRYARGEPVGIESSGGASRTDPR
jgi:hypothetical protein